MNKEKFAKKYDSIIKKLCNINIFTYVDGEINDAISFRVKTNTYFIPTSTKFNAQEEIKKIKNELDYNVVLVLVLITSVFRVSKRESLDKLKN